MVKHDWKSFSKRKWFEFKMEISGLHSRWGKVQLCLDNFNKRCKVTWHQWPPFSCFTINQCILQANKVIFQLSVTVFQWCLVKWTVFFGSSRLGQSSLMWTVITKWNPFIIRHLKKNILRSDHCFRWFASSNIKCQNHLSLWNE